LSEREEPTVFIVDDDAGICAAIQGLLRSVGLRSEAFGTPQAFLAKGRPETPACLLLDLQLPGLSGLDVQRALAEAGVQIPTIFITGHGDIPTTVKAMRAGAAEFLTKPFQDDELLRAVEQALAQDQAGRARRDEATELRRRYSALTAREREVMAGVVAGRLNKQIAAALGTSEITVKVHRGRLMKKMAADSVADLVRMADVLALRRG
jgi:FixJ family two-component response regulator